MSEHYNEHEDRNGAGFLMGLLAGTVIGAGLGMLFAPKNGSELRDQLSRQAESLANSANEGYRRASASAGHWAEKGRDLGRDMARDVADMADKGREVGRDMYGRAREAVDRGTAEAERYVKEEVERS